MRSKWSSASQCPGTFRSRRLRAMQRFDGTSQLARSIQTKSSPGGVMKTITRLIATGAAAIALATSSLAVAQDKVSLRLNWYLGGLHVPFYYGKDKGYYAAEGIDLTINEGRGSANTVQVVAAGSDTFGLADSSSVVLTASKGAEIKSVMTVLSSTGYSVVSLASAGIKTPKDLEGKKFAVSAGDPLGQLFRAMAAYNKLDMSKINFVQVDPAAKVVSVLE